MNPIPYEIYEAKIRYGKVIYPRPCVITSKMVDGRFSTMAISSAMELCKGLPAHFTIEETDPDFLRTGLKRTSYIDLDHISDMRFGELIRKRGQIDGELLKRLLKLI